MTWRIFRRDRPAVLPVVEVDGPPIDDLLHEALVDLAESVLDGDAMGDAWADYLMAKAALRDRVDEDGEPVDSEPLEDARDAAWGRLRADLPRVLRMSLPEARMVAGALDDVAGRVGEARTA